MKQGYDIDIERRAVYRNLGLLKDLGYEISDYDDNKVGYYLITREFEESELRFLMDAVYSASFIPPKHTKDLIDKLQSFQSIHKRKKYSKLKIIKPHRKTKNKEVFFNIEILNEATTRKKKVAFEYLTYDLTKTLKYKRKMEYIVNPYTLVCSNERYYLVCTFEPHKDVTCARLDRITNIRILDEDRRPLPKDFDVNDYVEKAIFMFGGEEETVKIKCKSRILNDVFDKFGRDVRIKTNDDDTFTVSLSVAPMGLKYWVFQYMTHCEVLSPQWFRKEIAVDIDRAKDKYDLCQE